ncbi:hypothetical protein MmiAt1_06630 [Methanimicrococcus sp. At1]|uniref:TM2 domain-containing protein n=1 Tax=Methanimicrococcus hacksteinii TaxID=3028293 RepID=A0ABU3VP18_9EURY|nr:hypothetical protein [Methanimicrococcus sp. At1]MDV0445106.1 hypothetical protein [Methanimicrococcus sp. At1]
MANPILSAVFSFFIPGLGQFYSGSFFRGILVFVGAIVASAVGVVVPIIGALIVLVYWLWNIYDAYSLAKQT